MSNVILTDSIAEEVEDLKKGIEETTNEKWIIDSHISNWNRKSLWKRIKRIFAYFYYPLTIFIKRKKYKKIIGWQQFYALIYCFYCRMFHVKKINEVYVLNFVYKPKKGIIGKLYHAFMKYIVTSKYIDILFVSSNKYINEGAKLFNIDKNKFKAIHFGVPDEYDKYKNEIIKDKFILSIGRSNRDYNWLIREWKDIDFPLYIISDTYKPKFELPKNIKIIDNISGNNQYAYIMNCKVLILPVDIENICSGDTVLLTAMSFKKNIIVTENSTLAEMYVINNKNGHVVSKKTGYLKTKIIDIIKGKINTAEAARDSFLKNYSRVNMGRQAGLNIKAIMEGEVIWQKRN